MYDQDTRKSSKFVKDSSTKSLIDCVPSTTKNSTFFAAAGGGKGAGVGGGVGFPGLGVGGVGGVGAGAGVGVQGWLLLGPMTQLPL